MELNKVKWEPSDKELFLKYLRSFKNDEKEAWTRNIINTKLELLCLTKKTLDDMVDAIYKGDYKSFLDLEIFDNYESILIYGKLLSYIIDYDEMIHYLDKYKDVMENWAHVDSLKYNILDKNKSRFIKLSDTYIHSDKEFIRRLGLMILFQMVKDKSVLPVIFKTLGKLKNETAYYVIMMAGWLLSECVIKYLDETLEFIKHNPELNRKIVNKGIQKCRESRRVSEELKTELLAYKR